MKTKKIELGNGNQRSPIRDKILSLISHLSSLVILSLISYLLSLASCDNPAGSQNNFIFPAPSALTLGTGDGGLHVYCTAIESATGYNFYYGTTEDPGAAKLGEYVPQPEVLEGHRLIEAYLTPLYNHIPYYVWAQALYADGESELFEAADSPMAPRAVPEGPPLYIDAYEDYNSIDISWERVPDRDNYPDYYADYYIVYYDTRGISVPADDTPKESFTWVDSCKVMGLLKNLENTPYYIWMSAVNTSGKSDPGERHGPYTPRNSPQDPDPVENKPVLGSGDASLSVQWNAVRWAQSYKVYYKAGENPTTSDPYIEAQQDAGTISASIPNLKNDINYRVGIAAVGSTEADISTCNNETPEPKPAFDMSNASLRIGKATARFPNEEAGIGDRLARKKETALADLLCDSMVWWANKHKSEYSITSDIDFALINGGAIDGGIPQGYIKIGTIKSILDPDGISIVQMKGQDILYMFNNRIARVPHTGSGGSGTGAFAQVSREIRFTLNYHGTKSNGSIENLTINDAAFDPDKTYCLVTSTYLAGGGDGYGTSFAPANKTPTNGILAEALCEYIYNQNMDLVPKTDGRLTLAGELWTMECPLE